MTKNFKSLLLSGVILAYASQAQASGYNLNEFSVTNLGRAFAGTGVVGDDYSALAFNPAAMVLKGSGAQIGVSVVEMHSDTRGKLTHNESGMDMTRGPKGRLRLYKTLPHGFVNYKINDKATMGMGVYSPFGLASVYNGDWFGSSHGIKTELEVVDTAIGGAYRVTDQVTLGMAVIYRYVHGNLINSITGSPDSRNQMDLDGWGWAYNFGMMYEPRKDTRFGISYRLNSAHTVKGKHKIRRYHPALDGHYPAETTMTLPNQLTLSAYHKLNDKFGVSGSARWTKWDVFDVFVLESSKTGTTYIPEKWENVWTFSLGLDYYYSPEWTFRMGFSSDPTPIQSSEYRTARIPDADRTWVTLGASYKRKNMTFDIGYAHLFMKTAMINNNDGVTTLDAKATGLSNMYGIQFQYDF